MVSDHVIRQNRILKLRGVIVNVGLVPQGQDAMIDLAAKAGGAILGTGFGAIVSSAITKAKYLFSEDKVNKVRNTFDELEKLSLTSEKENMIFKVSIPRGSYIMNGIAEFVSKLEIDNKIDITIHETNTMNTIDNVLNRYYDLGIIRYQSIYEDYYMRYLKNNNIPLHLPFR